MKPIETGLHAPITVQPKALTTMFSISRSTVTRLLNKMLLDEHYSKGVTRITRNLTLVNVELFKEYLFKQDLEGLKS